MHNEDVGSNKVSLITKIVGMALIALMVVIGTDLVKKVLVGSDKHPVSTKVENK